MATHTSLDLDWASILPLNGSKQNGFEELCTLIARSSCPSDVEFIRKGRPDSGVEAFAVQPDGGVWAWQAKYFQTIKDSQWKQLDESVRTALAGHSNLTRFIVCVPLDLPDGRVSGTISAMQRWRDRVATWSRWAAEKGMDVDFVWQGSHELLSQLARPANDGLLSIFFGGQFLDDAWFGSRLSGALAAAGPRYTPGLNVKLEIAKHFEALGRTKEFFDDIRAYAPRLVNRIRDHAFKLSADPNATLNSKIETAKIACEAALAQFKRLSDDPVQADPLENLEGALGEAMDKISDLLSEHHSQQASAKRAREASGLSADWRQESDHSYTLRQLHSDLSDVLSHVSEWRPTVNSKLAILTGNAGTGKTHLLCDLAQQRLAKGRPTVVLMGQQFLSNTDPWTQALQQLDLSTWTAGSFIKAFEVTAQRANCRALFVIDAINEGAGRQIWPAHLLPFLDRLKASPWISVVISVRSSYADDLLPDDGLNDSVQIEHHGFQDIEFDATAAFFEHYGIELPSSPLLAPEFSNPLYLKTLCQGLQASGQTRLTKGFHGVVRAFTQYISGINKKVANELDYNARRDLITSALKAVAMQMVQTRQLWLSYDEAERIVNVHLPGQGHSKSLMTALLREGLLIEERVWCEGDDEICTAVQIGYERLSDYLCVQSLLDNHLTTPDPTSAFLEGGPLDHDALCGTWSRPGFHEALHILIAERTDLELLDLVPSLMETHFTRKVFLDSIVWRSPEAVTSRTIEHLRGLMTSSTGDVIETFVTLATVPDHPLNAIYLDGLLRESSMADRDAWWTVGLHGLWDTQSAVDRLIHWAGRLWPRTQMTAGSVDLVACTLSWLLTSSHRYLRDHATKALVRVLSWRPAAIGKLIKDFAELDDAYVAERVVAAAYGATMRSTDAAGVRAIADQVHAKVFASGKPRPHLLMRDYARGIICRARCLQQDLASTKWPNSAPPYASDWPKIPTFSEIDVIVPDWSSKDSKHVTWGQRRIRSSVMSDDFGRYVIGTNSWTTNWLSLRLDEPLWTSLDRRIEDARRILNNEELEGWELFQLAAKQVCNERFDASLSGLIENTGEPESSENPLLTGSEQLLIDTRNHLLKHLSEEKAAILAPLMDALASESPSRLPPKFDLELVQRYVVGRVFELGWTPERFEKFDNDLVGRGREASKPERIGKKYQWIAYHEMLAYMADHYQYVASRNSVEIAASYQGSWQDDVRDIDPSNVMLRTAREDHATVCPNAFWATARISNWYGDLAPTPWAKITDDIPPAEELLLGSDLPSHSEWVNLHTFVKWLMPMPAYEDDRREIWIHADGALVRREDIGKLKLSELTRHGIHDGGLHQIFLGEVGWSEASTFFDDPYHSHLGWAGYTEPEEVAVIAATQGYIRERSGFDCSVVDETISLRLPTARLLKMLKAKWSGISATYVDNSGVVVAFDPSANVAGPSALLVRRERLQEILKANDLTVCWIVQGEKSDATGSPRFSVRARRSFSGLFVWDGKTISGKYVFGKVETFKKDD